MRKIKATAEKALKELPSNYTLTISEILQLVFLAEENGMQGIYEAITTAFLFGVAIGNRATRRGKIKNL